MIKHDWVFAKAQKIFNEVLGDTKRKVGNQKHANSIIGFHSLRGTFINEMLKQSWTIEQVSTTTGHASAEIIYKHYFKGKGTDYRDKLVAAMSGMFCAKTASPESAAFREIKQGLTKITIEERGALVKLLNEA